MSPLEDTVKKLLLLAAAAAATVFVVNKNKQQPKPDAWSEASDQV